MSFFSNIKRFHHNNVATLRSSPLAEISGALGDLGTLLPLMITLAVNGSISLSTTLVFSGFFNLVTGVVFGIPLPVQPMKAIAAAAIASRASERETMAAGSVTSVIVLVLSITGLLHWVTRVIPIPVIKGIQFGAGLSLIISAGTSLLQPLTHSWSVPLDNLGWSLGAFLLLILTQKAARFPYALIVFVVGLILAFVFVATSDGPQMPYFRVWQPFVRLPWWSADAVGMGIAQLPLTTLNSVIAAGALASDLLPDIPAPSVTALGLSVAVMNLFGCWFGAMPVCHGAGGLAAQYRFGARSGASIIMLGLFKVVLGIVFGETLLDLLRGFPKSLLGIMVIAAGLELAKVGQSLNNGASDLWESSVEHSKRHRDVSDGERSERWTVMLMTTAGILAFKNDAVGFVAGMLCHYTYKLVEWAENRRRGGRGLGDREPLLR
ncbi:Uu.00g096910.m01.CDS01 [Anthostomella pinea]|uniref:Uu.00g096910.m01.CDS01 n=1 Tax=Anthostomella pinea TaxID=933095 RepID=A0AAI8VCV1_9PEZI|nr:Uu.00g096910.m01.CDS01 [Anthostomella pinea]